MRRVSAGILNLALVAYAAAHGGTAWTGVLVAVWGAGSLAGGIAYGSRNWQAPAERRAMTCLALFGAALILLAATPDLAVLALLMIIAGLPLSPWLLRARPIAKRCGEFTRQAPALTALNGTGPRYDDIAVVAAHYRS